MNSPTKNERAEGSAQPDPGGRPNLEVEFARKSARMVGFYLATARHETDPQRLQAHLQNAAEILDGMTDTCVASLLAVRTLESTLRQAREAIASALRVAETKPHP